MPSLKPIRLRGVLLGAVVGDEAGLNPADVGDAIGEPRQLAHRVKGDLRIVGAGLHEEIAAGARRRELVAGEIRQIDEGLRPLGAKAVAIAAVLDEQPGAEAEGERQPRRRQAEHVGGIGRRPRSRPSPGMSTGSPGAQQPRAASVQWRSSVSTSARLAVVRSKAAK